MNKFLLLLFFFSQAVLADGQFNIFIKGIKNFPSLNARDVYVYLPNGYEKTSRHYPVLYMHDGQNLFDPTRAYHGQTWDALNTLNELIAKKIIEPLIVVAIDNTPDRMDEYIPENKGEDYLNFIINKIKPQVDFAFRTKTDPTHTGILGSSLGGLISFSAGLTHSEVFGLVGGLSPSIWWNNRSIIEAFNQSKYYPQKIYMDSGTVGGEEPQDVIDLSDLLLNRGFHHGQNMLVLIQSGADHQEYYWSQRLPVALRFLFPY